jgi:2-aminomuconate deaminase
MVASPPIQITTFVVKFFIISTHMQKIDAPNAPKPVGAYPHARRVGNLLFLSGIGPRDPQTNGVPGLERSPTGNYIQFDFAAQVHSVLQNVRTVLESSGAKWEDLVDITVFLTDMQRDFHTFNQIYATYFTEHQPCRTTVGINSLPTPIAIELKCMAVIA